MVVVTGNGHAVILGPSFSVILRVTVIPTV